MVGNSESSRQVLRAITFHMMYLSHTTALNYWRCAPDGAADSLPRLPDSSSSIRTGSNDWKEKGRLHRSSRFESLQEMLEASSVLHVMVTDPSSRKRSDRLRYHVCTSDFPDGSFVQVGSDVAVSSPELLLVQMAGSCSLHQLIELGSELCGTYSLPLSKNGQMISRETPHTTARRLSDYIGRVGRIDGIKLARRALPHVVEMSASPRETCVEMMLGLPERLGGFGIRKPEMNMQVDFDNVAMRISGRKFARCDLGWPDAKLDVEVDSTAYHSGEAQIRNDQARANALRHMGFSVISITNDQLTDFYAFSCVASDIAALTGKRKYKPSEKIVRDRMELHRLLLSGK